MRFILGPNHALISKGLRPFPDLKLLVVDGPNHALISKGLRPQRPTVFDPLIRPNHALISKGLRREVHYGFLVEDGSEPCPDLKGIKTRAPRLCLRVCKSEPCPDLKGIKTREGRADTPSARPNHALISKGLRHWPKLQAVDTGVRTMP